MTDFHCGRCGHLLDGDTDEPVVARELRAERDRLREALVSLGWDPDAILSEADPKHQKQS